MIGYYILIGIILLIAFILLIPIGIKADYNEDLKAVLKIGFVPITLYPPKPKKPKKKTPPKKSGPKKKESEKKKPSLIKEKGVGWLIDTVKNAAILSQGILKDFFRHVIIKKLQISITYSGQDADDTAVKYGYFCLSVYPAISMIVRAARCKQYGVDITPDFNEKAESEYQLSFQANVRVLWLLGIVLKHGFKAIKLLISLKNENHTDKEMIQKEISKISEKGEFVMEHPIGNLMNITMEKIKEMVDVNTIVGDPITSADGTLIIPVSKVSYGFASGGSDLPTKKENKDCFGGGSGAGVTIQPIAFLTVYQGNVRLISVNSNSDGFDKIIDMVPDVVDKVKGFFKKDKNDKPSGDDFSEITIDDIDI